MAYEDFDLQSQLDANMGSDYQNDNYGDPTQSNIDYLANQDVSQYYPNQSSTGSSGLSSSLLNSLLKLGTGAYGAYVTNQQGNAQQNIANQLLANADPYKTYRQQAEIPFMLAQMQQYGGMQNSQNQLLQSALNKATTPDPTQAAALSKMTGYDPLAGDYGFYQKQLQNSYTDPLAVYNSAGYQKLADLFGSQIARRDAAAGRLSQYGDRANEMQGNFLKYLDQYRSGLNSAAGTAGSNQSNYMNALINQFGGINTANQQQLAGLSNLFGQTTSGLNNLAGIITPRGTAGAGAGQAAQMQSSGSALNNAALSSLLSPVAQTLGG